MISINLLRENPQVVKDSQRKRGFDTKIVDEVLKLDEKWRNSLKITEKLNHERNVASLEIAKLKKEGKTATPAIKKTREITSKIQKTAEQTEKLLADRDKVLCTLPNILHNSVPQGKDDSENKEVRKWGDKPKFPFKPKDHIDLCEALDLYDIERAAKASGARFYYLKNELTLLELALAQYALNYLTKNGFTPIIPPNLVRGEVMYGAGMLPDSRKEIYKIQDEDLYLILTSEHAICGLHLNEVVPEAQLPERYCGFSPCYRTEAGSHGRDTKGIFRVHQFNKVEMFSFTAPETSWEEHELFLANAEKLVQGLKLPYRVVNVCTGDMGNTAAKKYDLEAWLPGQNAYREIISCSNCTDYQARRLGARCRRAPGDKPRPMHTINSTALAIGRTAVAILENYQQKNGSVKIPTKLQPYMNGLKVIKR